MGQCRRIPFHAHHGHRGAAVHQRPKAGVPGHQLGVQGSIVTYRIPLCTWSRAGKGKGTACWLLQAGARPQTGHAAVCKRQAHRLGDMQRMLLAVLQERVCVPLERCPRLGQSGKDMV